MLAHNGTASHTRMHTRRIGRHLHVASELVQLANRISPCLPLPKSPHPPNETNERKDSGHNFSNTNLHMSCSQYNHGRRGQYNTVSQYTPNIMTRLFFPPSKLLPPLPPPTTATNPASPHPATSTSTSRTTVEYLSQAGRDGLWQMDWGGRAVATRSAQSQASAADKH